MNVVLGVSGSVAAYRAADLARELMRGGATVRVCLTDGAQQFVTPALFEALTGQPCLTGTFEEPERGRMAHIDWARAADLVLVAPATANTLNRLAAGAGEDMLTTIVLAYDGPILVAPAMNPTMYGHPTTQAAIRALAARGVEFVEPDAGEVACGEQGQGKLAATERIAAAAVEALAFRRLLAGLRVLLTSGPTHEPIDDFRYIANRSSGKMGAALARAALWMGADVTVVTGPTDVPLPVAAESVRVQTAEEMLQAALPHASTADLVLGAAAVADFRVARPSAGKVRREEGVPEIVLERNPDVIAALALAARPGTVVCAFAAEPGPDLEQARAKLASKGVTAVAVNDVSAPGIGFGAEDNALTLLTSSSAEASGRRTKLGCARWLLERLAALHADRR